MSLTAPERETVILMNDEDGIARIRTHQRPIITKLSKNPAAEQVDSGTFEGTKWAEYLLPADLISFRTGKRVTNPGGNLKALEEARKAKERNETKAATATRNKQPRPAAKPKNDKGEYYEGISCSVCGAAVERTGKRGRPPAKCLKHRS